MNSLKRILNKLKCPICQSQIDGVYQSPHKVQNFWCAQDKDHYQVLLMEDSIKSERVNLYDFTKLVKYEIYKNYNQSDFLATKVDIYNIDAEGRVIFTFDDNSFISNIDIFDFKNFNAEKALNKIRTFMVFQ